MSFDFDAVKEAVSLYDILHRYGAEISDRMYGGSFRAACPLHGGDSHGPAAAFTFSEQDRWWYCHKCHVGGDVINLVARLEDVSNFEAAKKLAGDYQVDAEIQSAVAGARQQKRLLRTWRELAEAAPAVTVSLPPSVSLEEGYRGLSRATIDHFGLRRAVGGGDMWGTGACIPVRNEGGKLVGYTIRHPEGMEPKYLHSKGMDKSHLLYGLYENQQAIADKGEVILVEGQFDCIGLYEKGIRYAVAILGSALSVPQAHLLMRYTPRLVLMLDGDDAGRSGAAAIRRRWASAFDLGRINLPDGIDPDTADLKGLS